MKHGLFYPRVDSSGNAIDEGCMVTFREHLSREHRLIYLNGEIGLETESCNLLAAMDSVSQAPIKLVINSPGGVLDTTYLMYDTIRLLRSPVYTLAHIACSAAVILLACGAKRYAMPHSRIMIHLPSAQLSGDAEDLRRQQIEVDQHKHELVDILIHCGAKKSKKQILIDMDREYWMSAQESIDYGLVDEVITKPVLTSWLTSDEGVIKA